MLKLIGFLSLFKNLDLFEVLVIVVHVLELLFTLRLVVDVRLGHLVVLERVGDLPVVRAYHVACRELNLHRASQRRHSQVQYVFPPSLLEYRVGQAFQVDFEIFKFHQLTPDTMVGLNTRVVAFLAKPIS